MTKKTTDNVILMNLNDATALKMVKELATDSSNVFMAHHATIRKGQRHVSDLEILKCLRNGRVVERVHKTAHGNWKLTIGHFLMQRNIRVAVALDNGDDGNYLIVVTVIVVE